MERPITNLNTNASFVRRFHVAECMKCAKEGIVGAEVVEKKIGKLITWSSSAAQWMAQNWGRE